MVRVKGPSMKWWLLGVAFLTAVCWLTAPAGAADAGGSSGSEPGTTNLSLADNVSLAVGTAAVERPNEVLDLIVTYHNQPSPLDEAKALWSDMLPQPD